MHLFFEGILLGSSIAAPVGPIGVLCIRRTLSGGRLVGGTTGLGAATADALYGAAAAFGLTSVSRAMLDGHSWIALAGGLFLGYLGARTLLAAPAEAVGPAAERSTPSSPVLQEPTLQRRS